MNNNYWASIVNDIVAKKNYERAREDFFRKRSELERSLATDRSILTREEYLLEEMPSSLSSLVDRIYAKRRIKDASRLVEASESELSEHIANPPQLEQENEELTEVGKKFAMRYGDIVSGVWDFKVVESYSYQLGIESRTTEHRRLHGLNGIEDAVTVVEYLGQGRFRDLTTGEVILAAQDPKEKMYEMDSTYDEGEIGDYYYYSEEELLEHPLAVEVGNLHEIEDGKVLRLLLANSDKKDVIEKAISNAHKEGQDIVRESVDAIKYRSVENVNRGVSR